MLNRVSHTAPAAELAGQSAVILGAARQGSALARYLVGQGAHVTLSDLRPADALGQALRALGDLPVQLVLGGHPLSLLDKCDQLYLSGGVPLDAPIVVEARRRGIPLSNDAQMFLERCPATVVGITGSAGKTTTTALTGEMLKAAGIKTWVGGNIGNPLISDLDQISADDRVVMELSSFQLEVMTHSPRLASVLNITPNHLDRHPDMEAYVAAKRRILDFQSPGDVAVLGYDDALARSLGAGARGRVALFSAASGIAPGAALCAFVRYEGQHSHAGQIVLRLETEQVVCPLNTLKLRGNHNVLNVLAASLLARLAGADLEAISRVATSFTGVAHRLQLIAEHNGVRYYDDSIATAPERLLAALASFDEPYESADAPIVLLCGGRDKHLPWQAAAERIVQRVSQLILFGEMAGLVDQAVETALRALRGATALKRAIVGTLEQAVRLAVQVSRPGDVVLLSPGGTSFDAFRDFAERGDRFAECVRQEINSHDGKYATH